MNSRWTALGRRSARSVGKTDVLDAQAVATTVLREGGSLPKITLDDRTVVLDLLVSERQSASSLRSTTTPIIVPPAGEATNLCLYGPVLGQSPGGWPAGLYQVEFRLVGGANVGNGHLRID